MLSIDGNSNPIYYVLLSDETGSVVSEQLGSTFLTKVKLKSDKFNAFIFHEDLSEDKCPLMICKEPFAQPKGLKARDSEIFLALQWDDLVRVTSHVKPDMQWYFGQLDGQEGVNGWFPKRSVQLAPCQNSATTEELLEQAFSGMTVSLPKVPTELGEQAVH